MKPFRSAIRQLCGEILAFLNFQSTEQAIIASIPFIMILSLSKPAGFTLLI
jgi:hypothetical protein